MEGRDDFENRVDTCLARVAHDAPFMVRRICVRA